MLGQNLKVNLEHKKMKDKIEYRIMRKFVKKAGIAARVSPHKTNISF